MITYGILSLLLSLLAVPLAVIDLSSSLLPDTFQTALVHFLALPLMFEPLVPVILIYTLLISALGLELSILFFKVGFWFFDMVRKTIRGSA